MNKYKKSYGKQELIDTLHRFVEENGRIPKAHDMTIKNGYLPHCAYQKCFGTHNNALMEAGLNINQHKPKLNGTETCVYCNKTADEISNFIGWRYDENGVRYCNKHGAGYKSGKPDYVTGSLDINSNVALGRVGEILVAKVLNIKKENDYNRNSCRAIIDLYNEEYNKIDVKTALLNTIRNRWKFNFNAKKDVDTYICLGFDENRKHVEHVWIVSNEGKIKDLIGLSITNLYYPLLRRKRWEVDAEPYNNAYHSMSLENCRIMIDKNKSD